jgi:ubiquitin related modifier 1
LISTLISPKPHPSSANTTEKMESTISIKVEFSGGLELLFDNKRSHKLALPAVVPSNNDTKKDVVVAEGQGKPADVAYLIAYLRDHLLQERAELFEEGGTVCVFSLLLFPPLPSRWLPQFEPIPYHIHEFTISPKDDVLISPFIAAQVSSS